MAILWPQSLTPWIDPNGAPYSGALAYFFDAGTTTPKPTYSENGLGELNDHPVVANSAGRFGAVFIPTGDYRLRITDASGAVIEDIDGISVPSTGDDGGGGGGDTPVELLARTGDIKDRYDTGSHSGWVRCNARTIGNASSGAAERASADCEALFLLLWGADADLVVSGGRGATAAGDWAASKTIALPDLRLRSRLGLSGMGNTASTLLSGIPVDGGASQDGLGNTLGSKEIALSLNEIPSHNHGGATGPGGTHNHSVASSPGSGGGASGSGVQQSGGSMFTSQQPDHTHTVASAGGGEAHDNVQPSILITVYMKL